MEKKIDSVLGIESENRTEESSSQNNTAEYVSTYATTRVITLIVAFIGWMTVIVGGLIFIVTIIRGTQSSDSFQWFGLLPAIISFLGGLTLVMSARLTRIIVDNTDNTGKMLLLLRKIADK